MIDSQRTAGTLLRVLGLAFGVAAVVGGVVGQGILRSPGVVAQGVPYAELILGLWALGAVVTAVEAMNYGELGTSIPRAGGPYAFAARAFGPFGGFLVGWLDAGMLLIALGYIAVVVVEYLQRLGVLAQLPVGLFAAAIVLVFGVLNAFGTRAGGGLQNAASALKALGLFAFAAICFFLRGPERPPAPADAEATLTLAGLGLAAVAVQQTYYGVSTAVYFGEEVERPERNLARATFLGVAVVAAVYLAVNAALLYVLPVPQIAASNLPAAEALRAIVGSSGARAVEALALFSVLTVGNITVMQVTRTLFAIGRDGYLPRALAKVAGNGTPYLSLATVVVLGAALAGTGVYNRLLAVGGPILSALGLLMGVAVIRLRMKEPELARPYRVPLYPAPALFLIVMNAALIAVFVAGDPQNTRWSFLFLVVGAPVYWLTRLSRRAG